MAPSISTNLLLALSLQGATSFQTGSRSLALQTPRTTPPSHPTIGALFATENNDTNEPAATPKSDDCSCDDTPATSNGPELLQPFLPAMDPKYISTGPVGEGKFLITRTGPPLPEELTNEQMLQIVLSECTDLEVNTLVWKCLGYRFDDQTETWNPTEVFPNWKKNYPTPPDLIGMQRVYSKNIDGPSLRANQALVRSIPTENKQNLKPQLKPLGFSGWKLHELTPNKTRRAQCANWLIFYRDELFGYTVEELREKRRLRKEKEAEEEARKRAEQGDDFDEWKYPLKEVF